MSMSTGQDLELAGSIEGSIPLPTGTKREVHKFATIFGAPRSGKSTIALSIMELYRRAGWRPIVWTDPADKRPAPPGIIRVPDVDTARRVFERLGTRWGVYFHTEAHRPGVAPAGDVHPWLEIVAHEFGHDGPSLWLATQVPVEMDVSIRKLASFSILLYMGPAQNLEWTRRNFEPHIYETVRTFRNPRIEGRIRWQAAIDSGGN